MADRSTREKGVEAILKYDAFHFRIVIIKQVAI